MVVIWKEYYMINILLIKLYNNLTININTEKITMDIKFRYEIIKDLK